MTKARSLTASCSRPQPPHVTRQVSVLTSFIYGLGWIGGQTHGTLPRCGLLGNGPVSPCSGSANARFQADRHPDPAGATRMHHVLHSCCTGCLGGVKGVCAAVAAATQFAIGSPAPNVPRGHWAASWARCTGYCTIITIVGRQFASETGRGWPAFPTTARHSDFTPGQETTAGSGTLQHTGAIAAVFARPARGPSSSYAVGTANAFILGVTLLTDR